MSKNKRYGITQSLLSAFNGIFKYENGYEDFIKTLKKESKEPTQAMLDGIKFENLVDTYAVTGIEPVNSEWCSAVVEMGNIVKNAPQQVKIYKDIDFDEWQLTIYGILDFLKGGIIYDCKFSKTWKNNKYLDSPQHSLYLELVPEADRFIYLISDGKYLYKETYYRDSVQALYTELKLFFNYLKKNDLIEIYKKFWEMKK